MKTSLLMTLLCISFLIGGCVPAEMTISFIPNLALKNRTLAQDLILTGAPSATNNTTSLSVVVIPISSSNISEYMYKVGTTSSIDCSSSSGYSAAVNTTTPITSSLTGIADGSVTLCAVAVVDGSLVQSYANASTASWTKDTTAPVATLSGHASTYNGSSSLSISVSATNASDITSYRYKIGVDSISCIDPTGYSNITAKALAITDNISAFSANSATANTKICVLGIDAQGNLQPYASATSVSWITDMIAPTATLTGVPTFESSLTTLNVSVSAAIPAEISTYRYKLGYTEDIDCASSSDYSSDTAKASSIANDLNDFEEDRPLKICVIGKDSTGNEQSYASATEGSWNLIRSKIAVGVNGSPCSINREGVLRCWGQNDSGQLGDGTTANRLSPTIIDSGVSYLSVSSGSNSTCAITTSGVLKCWGYNAYGQLGDGTTANRLSPTIIDSGVSYLSVSIGSNSTCAITTSGVLKCWGWNLYGQLGDGTMANRLSPTIIDIGVSYSTVSIGSNSACAITTSGVLKCWGWNHYGQLGDGTTATRLSPTIIDTGVSYSTVSIGSNSTCAITTSGVLKCWGSNSDRQLGDGTTATRLSPTIINSGVSYSTVSITYISTCAITTNGVLKCWGNNGNGQIGDGTYSPRALPTTIDIGVNYSRVSMGYYFACALTRQGETKCWGTNGGYFGISSSLSSSSTTPVLVTSDLNISPPTGNSFLDSISLPVTTILDTETTGYKYKIGSESSINCSTSTGYSVTQDITQSIDENLGSIADGPIDLCLLPVNNFDRSPPYNFSKRLSWIKITGGLLSKSGVFETSNYQSYSPTDSGSSGIVTNTLSNIGGMDITNLSSGSPTLTSIFAYTGGSYPGINGTCGTTLPAGSSCSIELVFNPDETDLYTGGYSDSIIFTYDNGQITRTFNLLLFGATARYGCTDTSANNFNMYANVNDNSCVWDCEDPSALNFHTGPNGGACTYPVYGCTNPTSFNYSPSATHDDGTCVAFIYGCTNSSAGNYSPTANTDDGSCSIGGCTDSNAINYNSSATYSDGSCAYPVYGCMDPGANNYSSSATHDDGSCAYPVYGCMDPGANNYSSSATHDDGSCSYNPSYGCMDSGATNYNSSATVDDGSCSYPPPTVYGCTDSNATNYDPSATNDDGSCSYPPPTVFGCTDLAANNYNPSATSDDGSCSY
jgi:alpha-tubulin suppressor-like RCC1 family protein